jgi:hypothetical protein
MTLRHIDTFKAEETARGPVSSGDRQVNSDLHLAD